MRYRMNQESAIASVVSNKTDVVKSNYKGLQIFRTTDAQGRPCLHVFRGRSSKAVANYFYRSLDRREETIAELKATADSHEEYDLKKKAEKKAAGSPKSEIGAIFVNSWGYDQTNVDYYEVIERPSKHFAIVRSIGASRVEGSEGFDCCQLMPEKGSFIEKSEPIRVKLTTHGHSEKGVEYFKVNSYSSARTWGGTSNYCSWYA